MTWRHTTEIMHTLGRRNPMPLFPESTKIFPYVKLWLDVCRTGQATFKRCWDCQTPLLPPSPLKWHMSLLPFIIKKENGVSHRQALGQNKRCAVIFVAVYLTALNNVKWPNIRHAQCLGTPRHIKVRRGILLDYLLLDCPTSIERIVQWHKGRLRVSFSTSRGFVWKCQGTFFKTILDHSPWGPWSEDALPRWRGQ